MSRLSTDLAPIARSGTLVLDLFTAAVFLSALLLFGVQPMFARMVLPELGGSPSVWSVAMVFFQSMVLAGYAYAHLLTQTRKRWLAVTIHFAVLASAVFMRANIGCTPKRSRALRNTAAVKRSNTNVPLRAMGAKSVESRDILIPDG